MAIKSFNPYSPSRRFITVSTFEEITTRLRQISRTVLLLRNFRNMLDATIPAK